MISNLIDSRKSWIAREHDRPAGMEVRLLKQTVVLPWSQFINAEGDHEKIRIAFSTHDLVVAGHGLGSLLEDLAAQRVSLLREPGEGGTVRFLVEPAHYPAGESASRRSFGRTASGGGFSAANVSFRWSMMPSTTAIFELKIFL